MAALADMEHAVNERKVQMLGIDESAERIQRAARRMISRIRFRTALYKLIIFRNIIENKMHKEKMAQLFAFEQLIINTEEAQEEEEMRQQEEELLSLQNLDEQGMKEQIMKLTNVSSSTSSYILQALMAAQEREQEDEKPFQLNAADIIQEDEYEESVDGMSYRK